MPIHQNYLSNPTKPFKMRRRKPSRNSISIQIMGFPSKNTDHFRKRISQKSKNRHEKIINSRLRRSPQNSPGEDAKQKAKEMAEQGFTKGWTMLKTGEKKMQNELVGLGGFQMKKENKNKIKHLQKICLNL